MGIDFFFSKVNLVVFRTLSDLFKPTLIEILDEGIKSKESFFHAKLLHDYAEYDQNLKEKHNALLKNSSINFKKKDLVNLAQNRQPESQNLCQLYDENLYTFYAYVIIGIYKDVLLNTLKYLNLFKPKEEGFFYKDAKFSKHGLEKSSISEFFFDNIFVESSKILFFREGNNTYMFVTEWFFLSSLIYFWIGYFAESFLSASQVKNWYVSFCQQLPDFLQTEDTARRIFYNFDILTKNLNSNLDEELLSPSGIKLASILNTIFVNISCRVESSYQSSIYKDFGIEGDFLQEDTNSFLKKLSEKLLRSLPELEDRVNFLKSELPLNSTTNLVLIFNLSELQAFEKKLFNSNGKISNLHNVLAFYILTRSIEI